MAYERPLGGGIRCSRSHRPRFAADREANNLQEPERRIFLAGKGILTQASEDGPEPKTNGLHGDHMAHLDDQSWQKVDALLQELPSYQTVSTSARDDIERICGKLLESRSFYTTRAPDARKEIADLEKAGELADMLRDHLLAMIRARNGRFMTMEIHEDPDFFDPIDGFFNEIHRYPAQIREVQPLTGENYIGLLEAFSRNCEWVRRRLQGDVWEYGVTAAGPRALHDEKHAFAGFMAIWRKAGGRSLIQFRDDLDPDKRHYGPTLDYLQAIFSGLAAGKRASDLKFTIPSPSTLRSWCSGLEKGL